MAESIHNQIAAAIVTNLEAITGDSGTTYWYTPDQVVRCSTYDRVIADASIKHIYALRAGEETHDEDSTGSVSAGGGIRAVAEFYLLMLRRDERATLNPYEETSPTRATVVDRVVRDVLCVLWDDVTLGGLAHNIVAGSLLIDRDVDIEGKWAVAEARFSVEYSYMAKTP